MQLFELQTELFFVECHLHLREQVINKIWLFRLGYLAVIFLKINEVSLSLEGEQTDSTCCQ